MDFSMFENILGRPESKPENNNQMSRFPEHTPLAMAYVPLQQWGETYNLETGFEKGTVFPELDFPFDPEEGCYGFEK